MNINIPIYILTFIYILFIIILTFLSNGNPSVTDYIYTGFYPVFFVPVLIISLFNFKKLSSISLLILIVSLSIFIIGFPSIKSSFEMLLANKFYLSYFSKTYRQTYKEHRKTSKLNIVYHGDIKYPVIYVMNHYYHCPNIIPLLSQLPSRIKFISDGNFSTFGTAKKGVLSIGNDKNKYEHVRDLIRQHISQGFSVFVAADDRNTPFEKEVIVRQRFRTGIFRISRELNIPIYPIAIDWENRWPSIFKGFQTDFNLYISDSPISKLSPEEMAESARQYIISKLIS